MILCPETKASNIQITDIKMWLNETLMYKLQTIVDQNNWELDLSNNSIRIRSFHLEKSFSFICILFFDVLGRDLIQIANHKNQSSSTNNRLGNEWSEINWQKNGPLYGKWHIFLFLFSSKNYDDIKIMMSDSAYEKL